MADTAHKTEEAKQEFFDSEEELTKKINTLADLIMKSKHFIAFTGAGISTSCGIPDFRSGINTVLKTGPGAWEKKAQGVKDVPNKNVVEMAKAIPSFTHMTLIKLEQEGYLKYLISQNTDGLHLRSGFDTKKLAQLHGNRCLEKCKKCKSQFLRDFRTRQAQKVHDHETSRKCQKCKGILYDSIINFGETLPQYQIGRAFQEGQKADLCLSMGSSLTVTPAADVPALVGKRHKLIIINLQKTPLDKLAYMKINALCDDVMKRLADKMQLKVQNFMLERKIDFKINKQNDIQFRGVDSRGTPFTFFKDVSVSFNNEKVFKSLKGQPYITSLNKKDRLILKFDFYGYLGQPSYQLLLDKEHQGIFKMTYDPKQSKWVDAKWLQDAKKQEESAI